MITSFASIEKIYTKYGFNSKQFSKIIKKSYLPNVVQFLLSLNLTDKPEIVEYLQTIKQPILILTLNNLENLPIQTQKTIYLNLININSNLTEYIFKKIYDGRGINHCDLRKNSVVFSFKELSNFNLSQLNTTDMAFLLVDLVMDKREIEELPVQNIEKTYSFKYLKLVINKIKPMVNFSVLELVCSIINNSQLSNSYFVIVLNLLGYSKQEIKTMYIQAYNNKSYILMEMLVEFYDYLPKSLFADFVIKYKKDKAFITFMRFSHYLSEDKNKELLAIIKNNHKHSQISQIKEIITKNNLFDKETTLKIFEDFNIHQFDDAKITKTKPIKTLKKTN